MSPKFCDGLSCNGDDQSGVCCKCVNLDPLLLFLCYESGSFAFVSMLLTLFMTDYVSVNVCSGRMFLIKHMNKPSDITINKEK